MNLLIKKIKLPKQIDGVDIEIESRIKSAPASSLAIIILAFNIIQKGQCKIQINAIVHNDNNKSNGYLLLESRTIIVV